MQRIVLIVDDHPLVGEALELSVSAAYPHLNVGRVTSMTEAEAYARANGPRIKLVMLDLVLPDVIGFSGLLTLQQILPGRPIIMVSGRSDPHTVALAKTFGASAFLNKCAPVSDLVNAVGTVLRGETVVVPGDPAPSPAAADFHKKVAALSAGQLRILNALADGRLNKQIAADLNLTEGTVKQHMSAIFKKLGVTNRSQAILAAAPYLRPLQG